MNEASRRAAVEQLMRDWKELHALVGLVRPTFNDWRDLETKIDAAIARAVANVQHVCTKCGYITVTQSVETQQCVARAVEGERE